MAIRRIHKGNQPYEETISRELCSVEGFTGTFDKNADQYMVHNGVVLQSVPSDEFRIDISLIPEYVMDSVAAATLDFVRRMMEDPDIRERIEERKAAKRICSRNSNYNS